jgi:ankyrin repeat protein
MNQKVDIDRAHINDQGAQGQTALMRAVSNNDVEAVQNLVDNDALLDIQDIYGCTALMKAAYLANPEILGILIRAGARLDLQTRYRSWTALNYAVASGDCVKVQMLLATGAYTKNEDKKEIRELADLDCFLKNEQDKHDQSISRGDAVFYEEE